MRLTLASCGGEKLAALDADPAWQLNNVLMALPQNFPQTEYSSVRVFFGTTELRGQSTLLDLGARDGEVLHLVHSKLPRAVTASKDRSAKIWSTTSGACLHTLTGHGHAVHSMAFSTNAPFPLHLPPLPPTPAPGS